MIPLILAAGLITTAALIWVWSAWRGRQLDHDLEQATKLANSGQEPRACLTPVMDEEAFALDVDALITHAETITRTQGDH